MSSNILPRSATKNAAAILLALCTSALMVACGGGDSVVNTTRYTIGGAASGLVGTGLVLQDNSGDNLTVSASGSFTFAAPLTNGSSYSVGVATQPTDPSQNCVVTDGAGTVSGAHVTSVVVTCSTNGFTVGGSVSGLSGGGLVLQDNGGDDLPITAAGNFTFSQTIGSGVAYAVSVKTQPTNPTQTCVVVNGSGTMGSANAANVAVNCATSTYTVSVAISGVVGVGLILEDNATDDLPVSTSGNYTFATAIASGATYAVSVKTAPANPTQTCTVTNGSGTIGAANITNVAVVCTVNGYALSGTVTGLSGSGLILQTNGGNAVPITANGPVALATLPSGTGYTVTVATQPSSPTQTCVVATGTGTITSANVTNVVIACTTNTYQIIGTFSGVGAGDTVIVKVTGANAVSVSSNGPFILGTIASGTAYTVAINTQPTNPSQTCVVTNPTGTVAAANVTNVAVACTTNTYTVGGNVTGLSGAGLVLSNGGTLVPVPSGGTVTFATLNSGTAYSFIVQTQPSNPTQTCTVANPTGTVTSANITNVNVTCTTNTYSVGGTVTGLTGTTGVVLSNSGTPVTVTGSGVGKTYVTLNSGASYNFTVQTNPTNPSQTCSVANPAGTVVALPVSNVNITCTTNTYTVTANVTDAVGTPSGLVLQDNGGDNLTVAGTGSNSFATLVASGAAYAVTVMTQPSLTPQQYCIALNPSGTVTNANITVNVTCSNEGQSLFVANTYDGADGSVSGFTINPGDGSLTVAAGSPFAADLNPTGIALAQGGHLAYVSNLGSSDISTYTVGAGAVLSLNTLNGTGSGKVATGVGTNPVSVAVDPAGQYLYVGSDVTHAIGEIIGNDIGSGTGILTAIAGPPASPFAAGNTPFGLAVDPATHFVFATYQYQNGMAVFSIDAGGTLANVANSPFATGDGPIGVAVYPAGGFFVYTANSGAGTVSAFAYDPSSGALSELISLGSPYPAGGAPTGITIDPTGRFLYVTNYGASTVSTFSIAPLTGQLTAVGTPVATGNSPTDIKVDPSGHFAYVANFVGNTVSVFTINPTTGVLSPASTQNAGTGSAALAIE
jgi:6-phosphogluconolactonase (cycloisomerase 2 family)